MSASDQFNSDELVPPSFLTEEYFHGVLKTIEKDPELNLLTFCVKPGSAAGDHYASIIQKVTASYETQGHCITERRFILKTIPDEGQKQKQLSQLPVFVNESRMYFEVLAAMEQILRQCGEERWWPSLLYASEDPLVIVFNDVTMDGYSVDTKHCDMEDIQLLVEKIAKYHALSMVLIERGTIDLHFENTYATEAIKEMLHPMKAFIRSLGKAVKLWEGFERIGEKMESPSMADRVVDDMLVTLTTDKSGGFVVLNHGDFHIRNLMFRAADDQNGREVLFLDFQIPLLNSPAFDLNSLLSGCGNYEVRERRDEVLHAYHRQLVEGLKRYGFKDTPPSAIDVQVEMLRSSALELYQTLAIIQVVNIPDLQIADLMGNGNATTTALEKLYEDPVYMAHMKILLRSLDNRGMFD